jgi:hypothetical protein
MAERIKVISDLGHSAKFLLKVSPPLCNLPDDRFEAGHVDIGLEIPAAARCPSPFPNKLPDFLEKGRIITLHPLIKNGLVMAKNEPIVLVKKVDGGTERC